MGRSKYAFIVLGVACVAFLCSLFSFAPNAIYFEPSRQVWEGVAHDPSSVMCVYIGQSSYQCDVAGEKRVAALSSMHQPAKDDVSIRCLMVPGPVPLIVQSSCVLHFRGKVSKDLVSEQNRSRERWMMGGCVMSFLVGGVLVFVAACSASEDCRNEIRKLKAERDAYKKKIDEMKKVPPPPAANPNCVETAKSSDMPDTRCLLVFDKTKAQTILVPLAEIPIAFLMECPDRARFVIKRGKDNKFYLSYPSEGVYTKIAYTFSDISAMLPDHPDYAKIAMK